MRFYGLSDDHVLKMPVRLFWSACSTIERLKAAEELSLLDLLLVSNSMGGGGDELKRLKESLVERLGTPVYVEKPKTNKADILALMES